MTHPWPSGAIPVATPNIGTTGVVESRGVEQFLQSLFQGLEARQRSQALDQQKQQLKLAQAKYKSDLAEDEARQRENAALGEALRGLLLSNEPQTQQLPAGAIPFGSANAMPLTLPAPETPYAQTLRQLPATAVPRFAEATKDVRRQQFVARATEQALERVPEPARPAVRSLIELAAVAPDLPAEVRTDLYRRTMGETAIDDKGFTRFLAVWRTGVVPAQDAARAAGIPLPPGIPGSLKARIVPPDQARDREINRISRAMQGLNTLIDNADRQLTKERQTINQSIGGAFYKRTGQFAGPDDENKATIAYNRRQQALFPQYREWQRQIAALQEQLTQTLEGQPSTPQPSQQENSPDELDRLINESLQRRRSAPARP